jgi:hypothetical protein
MRRAAGVAFTNCLGGILAGLVLMHGLIAAPLLVECVGADGRSLVELAGHDPCHHPARAVRTSSNHNSGQPSGLSSGEWQDPCLDLTLYKPADAPTGAGFLAAPTHAAGEPADPFAIGFSADRQGAAPETPPELLFLPDYDVPLPLRI